MSLDSRLSTEELFVCEQFLAWKTDIWIQETVFAFVAFISYTHEIRCIWFKDGYSSTYHLSNGWKKKNWQLYSGHQKLHTKYYKNSWRHAQRFTSAHFRLLPKKLVAAVAVDCHSSFSSLFLQRPSNASFAASDCFFYCATFCIFVTRLDLISGQIIRQIFIPKNFLVWLYLHL